MVQPSKSEWVRVLGWLLSAILWAMPGLAQGRPRAQAIQARARRQVLVSIPDRKLVVVENGVVVRTFAVSVGAADSPSPTGKFEIVNRLAEPTYYHAGVVIRPGSRNPLGPRWVGLNKKGYGIHGTNAPGSVGKAASHGCIRLRNRDIVEFASLVNVGDSVEIHDERDSDLARIFGRELSLPAAVAQTQEVASVVNSGQ